jgi:peptidoglycan hydrolase-like protein with peptidoglycan-binding domain
MKRILMTTGIAVLALATVVGAASYTFNTNLTVGSTGADVVALQTALMAAGYDIPAITSGAASKGYFGSQTQAAVKLYQAAKGIPNTGFVGPLTRGALNGAPVASTPVACPVGYVCTLVAGTPGTTPTVPGVISTPGAEGTLTVTTNNAGLVSTVYEGETMRAIYGMNVEADNSDILVQRVKINLGTNTAIYNKGYTKLYVTDGTNVLASVPLNSSTVVKESTTYYVTVSGFSLLVPKDTKKQLVLKADVMSSIDTTDRDTLSSISITIPANGVRGVDGAGIDQYGPSSALTSRSTTFSAELAESATLKLSLNSASPKKTDVVAAAGSSENEMDKLTLLTFDVKAEKDDVKVTDMYIGIAKTGTGGATASTTVYIFDGATEVDSASVTGNVALFSDFDQVISRDATKTYTVKADVRNANGTLSNLTATASSSGVTSENTKGDNVTESGSATGYAIGVRNAGPTITLVSKSLSKAVTEGPASTGVSTSTLTANFVFDIKAVGGDVMFGLTQSTSSPFFASTSAAGTKSFTIYKNGSTDATVGANATSTSFAFESICSTSNYTNSCVLSEGNSVRVSATIAISSRTAAGDALATGNYAFGISALNWVGPSGFASSTFMAGETDWMTSEVTFP